MPIFAPFAFSQQKFSFLFDEYPDADFGVSLRQLSSDYTGPCVKVRRTSDNATSEIGFLNYEINQSELLSFAGASSLTIDTWYDQSGNGNNLTMPDTARQPALVLTGSLVTGSVSNAKPSLFFNGVNMIMTGSNFTSGDSAASIFNVYNTAIPAAANSATMFLYMIGKDGGTYSYFKGSSAGALAGEYMTFGTTTSTITGGRLGSSGYRRAANTLVIEDEYWLSGGSKFYQNASQVTLDLSANGYTTSTNVAPSTINPSFNQFTLGAFVSGVEAYLVPHNGKISELVSWPSDKSSQRTLIQQQINNFYKVY